MKDKEIEIQVNIENSEPLLKFLKEKADFKYENKQIDEYFSPFHRNFTETRPINEWLRLRDSDNRCFINYKNFHRDEDGKGHYCDEYETVIEDIGQVKKILNVLNFKQIAIVEKMRKVWNYGEWEVALDSVKGLGDYVEIEYIGEDKNTDHKKIAKEMIDFLKELGCGKIQRNFVGYPFQLMFPEETEFEEQ